MAVLRSLTTTLGLNSAQFRSELKRAQRSYKTFGKTLLSGVKSTKSAFSSLTSSVVSIKSAFLALGTGAAIYGIKQAYTHADEIRRQATMVGVAADQWSSYSIAAQQVGLTSDQLSDVFKDLNVRITDAAKTGGGAMADFFSQINGDAREWAALSPDEQFRKFARELQGMTKTDARFWLDEVNDSAVQLYETIVQNDGEFFRLAKEAEQLGLSLTTSQFDLIAKARRDMEGLAVTGESVWQQVLAAAAPAVSSVSIGIRQWINDQAAAAGGFRQLGVLIVETVLAAVVDVANSLEGLLNGVYINAEKVAALVGKTLNPERNTLQSQLEYLNEEYGKLLEQTQKVGFDSALGVPTVENVGTKEQFERLKYLEKQIVEVRQDIESPFHFSSSLESSVSRIVAKIKSAQNDISDNAPSDAFGAASAPGATETGNQYQEEIKKRLDALRDSYASEQTLLVNKISLERETLQQSLDNRLILEQEYRALSLQSEEEYQERLLEIERQAAIERGELFATLQRKWQQDATTFTNVWANAMDSFTTGVGDSVAGAVVDGDNFGQSMDNVAHSIARSMISALVQIGAQRMALWTMEKTLGASSGAAMTTAVAGEASAGVNLAMLNAFSSTAAIPVVGPELAPAAAAAAGATATPFATAAVAAASSTIAGARALGGQVQAGSTYLVGERGAELFVPRADGQITSHDKLAAAVRGAGTPSGTRSVTLAPQIVVESGASQSGDEFLAESVAEQVFSMIINDANNGGYLSRALGAR